MNRLKFSVANQLGIDDTDDIGLFYQKLTTGFKEKHNAVLEMETVSWERLWVYLHQTTQQRSGCDISEVGSTWVGSLGKTDTLLPIPDSIITPTQNTSDFVDKAWESLNRLDTHKNIFLPWLLDVRVIYYWKDHLEKAGVDESRAFSSTEAIEETMQRLSAAGQPGWGAATFSSINTLYNMVSWIWSKGGSFISHDGKRTTFSTPEAIAGMNAYFSMAKYMPEPMERPDALDEAFETKQISAFVSGPWALSSLIKSRRKGMDYDKVGIALPPGPPFVGGANLIVWRHIADDKIDLAFQLLRHLLTPNAQTALHEMKGLIPVNSALLQKPPFSTDPNYQTIIHAISRGRFLSTSPLWSHLESSLTRAFALVWGSIKQNDLRYSPDMLERHLSPLASRFDRMLEMF